MIIQHNIPAMNAYRNLNNNQSQIAGNLEKLSSGYQINRAGDNAAGLAISEKMRSQITGLGAAQTNVDDGISLVKTAEGALQEVHDMLNRMTELATLSANGTYTDKDRAAYQLEVDELMSEINRISDSTNFNGIALLDGTQAANDSGDTNLSQFGISMDYCFDNETWCVETGTENKTLEELGFKVGDTVTINGEVFAITTDSGFVALSEAQNSIGISSAISLQSTLGDLGVIKEDSLSSGVYKTTHSSIDHTNTNPDDGLRFQIGDTSEVFNMMKVSIDCMSTEDLGLDVVSVSTQSNAGASINVIKSAINAVSMNRARLGATQNRLEHTKNNLSVQEENIQDAESTIRDTDVAEEMMAYTKNNILIQSAQSMLAQANQLPQGVLQLLG